MDRRIHFRSLAPLFCALGSMGLGAQTLYYDLGVPETWGLGHSLARVPDVDGDGVDDLVCGARRTESNRGAALLFSGATGALLRRWDGTSDQQGLGISVAGIGDLDGDGAGEVLVTSGLESIYFDGFVEVFSGATGRLIRRHDAVAPQSRFGYGICSCGDLDADGRDDYAVSAPDTGLATGFVRGVIRFFSGADGSELLEIQGGDLVELGLGGLTSVDDCDGDGLRDLLCFTGLDSIGQQRRWQVLSTATGAAIHSGFVPHSFSSAALGDLDGDGVGEFVLGINERDVRRPSVEVRSGRTGELIAQTLKSATDGVHSIASAGDLDGDGLDEILLGCSASSLVSDFRGAVRVVDGRTGAVLRTVWGPGRYAQFGAAVLGLGDIDGDGFDDWAGGATGYDIGTLHGLVRVFTSDAEGTPARTRTFGVPCEGSDAALPRIDHRGELRFGTSLDVLLRSALPGAPTVLALAAPLRVPGDLFGAPGCTLLVAGDGFNIGRSVDAGGRARVEAIPVPDVPALTGAVMRGQWLTMDPAANALGATFSDALEMQFGT